jgi:hypothetical protein
MTPATKSSEEQPFAAPVTRPSARRLKKQVEKTGDCGIIAASTGYGWGGSRPS